MSFLAAQDHRISDWTKGRRIGPKIGPEMGLVWSLRCLQRCSPISAASPPPVTWGRGCERMRLVAEVKVSSFRMFLLALHSVRAERGQSE